MPQGPDQAQLLDLCSTGSALVNHMMPAAEWGTHSAAQRVLHGAAVMLQGRDGRGSFHCFSSVEMSLKQGHKQFLGVAGNRQS